MSDTDEIPYFTLYSETTPFPDVVHCERIKTRASETGWVISPHRHSQMAQIFIIQSGHANYQLDGRSGEINPNHLLYVPPLVVHGFQFQPQTEGLVISIPMAVARGLADKTFQAVGQTIEAEMSVLLMQLIAQLEQCLITAATFRASVAVGLTHAILGHLAEFAQTQEPDQPHNHLQELDRLIMENMGQDWSAADYATALSITTGHLSRLCRAAKGVGVTAYVETATMSEACRQLAFTRQAVSEIGYRLGYNDPSYFARRFRTLQGVTPTKYRADFLG